MYPLQNSRFLSLVKLCLSGDLLIALYKKTFYVMDTFAVMISTLPVSAGFILFLSIGHLTLCRPLSYLFFLITCIYLPGPFLGNEQFYVFKWVGVGVEKSNEK
jgi:hypothetical protein